MHPDDDAAALTIRPAWMIVRRFMASRAGRRFGQIAVDLAVELGITAAIEMIRRALGWGGLSRDESNALRELQRFVGDLEQSIRRNGNEIRAVREEMEQRHGWTQRQLNLLDQRVAGVDRRLREVETRLLRVERKTTAQAQELRQVRRTLIDQHGRIVELEGAVADHNGRITDLEGRTVRLEDLAADNRVRIDGLTVRVEDLEDRMSSVEGVARANQDRSRSNETRLDRDGYYDKHLFALSLQALYPRAQGGDGGLLGGAFDVTYLFSEFLGVFGSFTLAPTRAHTAPGYALSTDPSRAATLVWDHYAGFVGAYADVLPGNQPVALRIGAGVGLVVNDLIEMPADAGSFDRSETTSLDRRTNAAALARIDLGFSPKLFPFEPFATVGVSAMLDPVAFDHPALVSNEFGTAVQYVAAGFRYRWTTADQYNGRR
ncbi:hypothetical protein [Rubrivirga sp. IMCC45206]|uniref:hypothetical protein n=1 Tax=Rubrivirga sp. IMCC45206 TaxID=3391614 RepID=UPI00399011E8